MMRTGGERATSWQRTLGRAAALVMVLGGASAAVAPSVAGAASSAPSATEISTAKTKLGMVLVAGDTPVYTLAGNKTCDTTCQKTQPPVLLPAGTMAATAGSGVDASKLGTVPGANGELQVTYAGKPLYWSSKDKNASAVHGNGKNKFGTWTAVVIAKTSSNTKSPSTTNSGNGGVGF
jgi:predicted lipoprotein with Yx(FWY)xxD motif